MSLGGIYDTGTAVVTNGSDAVTGTGVDWSDVLEGDWFVVPNEVPVLIDSVNEDGDEITLTKNWPGLTYLTAPTTYEIYKMSWLRYDPAITQAQLNKLLTKLRTIGIIYYVEEGEEPDVGVGEDGEFALAPFETPWRFWVKASGVWVVQGTPAGLNPQGAWSALTAYLVNDIVTYNGSAYRATVPNTNSAPGSSPASWEIFVQKGDTGSTGATGAQGLNWLRAWNSATAYVVDDAVEYGGSSYIATAPNTNEAPAASPSSWDLVAQGASVSDGTVTVAKLEASVLAGFRGTLAGLTLSNNATDATNDFDVAAGIAMDKDFTDLMLLSAALTGKRTDAAWTVGSGNGAIDPPSNAGDGTWHVYAIKRPDTQVVDVLASRAPDRTSTVTISNGSPGVVTWTDHGLEENAPVVLSTTGTLPTGLSPGSYYVKTVLSADTFTVSATEGGSVINTSSAGSGTHTAVSAPTMPDVAYTKRRRIGAIIRSSAAIVPFKQYGNKFIRQGAPSLDVDVSNAGSSAATRQLTSIPKGLILEPIMTVTLDNTSGVGEQVYLSALTQTDTAVSGSVAQVAMSASTGGVVQAAAPVPGVITNRRGQIRSRQSSGAASTNFRIKVSGWIDLELM